MKKMLSRSGRMDDRYSRSFCILASPCHPTVRSAVTWLRRLRTVPVPLPTLLRPKVLLVDAAKKGSLFGVGHRCQFLVVVEADAAVWTALAVLPPINVLVF